MFLGRGCARASHALTHTHSPREGTRTSQGLSSGWRLFMLLSRSSLLLLLTSPPRRLCVLAAGLHMQKIVHGAAIYSERLPHVQLGDFVFHFHLQIFLEQRSAGDWWVGSSSLGGVWVVNQCFTLTGATSPALWGRQRGLGCCGDSLQLSGWQVRFSLAAV